MPRREALEILSAIFAMPLLRWPGQVDDPLAGKIVDYPLGRIRGEWTSELVVQQAIERGHARHAMLHCIDQWSATALDEARAYDTRARARTLHGPLDGVPLFAKHESGYGKAADTMVRQLKTFAAT